MWRWVEDGTLTALRNLRLWNTSLTAPFSDQMKIRKEIPSWQNHRDCHSRISAELQHHIWNGITKGVWFFKIFLSGAGIGQADLCWLHCFKCACSKHANILCASHFLHMLNSQADLGSLVNNTPSIRFETCYLSIEKSFTQP